MVKSDYNTMPTRTICADCVWELSRTHVLFPHRNVDKLEKLLITVYNMREEKNPKCWIHFVKAARYLHANLIETCVHTLLRGSQIAYSYFN